MKSWTCALVAAVAAVALGVSACAPEAADEAAAAFDLSLYPTCDDENAEGGRLSGCVLTDEGMLHALLASHEEGVSRVQVVVDGEAGQLIEEASTAPAFFPTLADLNGDPLPDLLVPIDTGNVNTVWAVYLAEQDAAYTRAGEISGVGWGPSTTGLLAVPARSSAVSWEVSFFDVEPGGLTLIATAGATLSEEGGTPTCELVGTPVLGAQTMEEAVAQYCGDPAVAGLWSDAGN